MKNQLLHTPEGVRDIYNEECERKIILEGRLLSVLKSYGYHPIQTPTFEFFDIFGKEIGTTPSRDLYKFFDREGNTLVLRPDITPSIARCASKYYIEQAIPIRLCYTGNTFRNNSSYQGRLKEATQTGVELIGDDTSQGDAEMIAMVIQSLKEAGLTEFQVELGQVEFYRSLTEEVGMDEETREKLRILIENKNYFGVEELLSEQIMTPEQKQLFLKLPELFGDIDQIRAARCMTSNPRALQAIDRLERVQELVDAYGLGDYVSYDLGMLSKYSYYTGIIFKAYTYGTGEYIVTGGRYDRLLEQFGKKAPAVGFAIVVDQLMLALSRQKIQVPVSSVCTALVYGPEMAMEAIPMACSLRSQGETLQMVCRKEGKPVEAYEEWAAAQGIGRLLFLSVEEKDVLEVNLETGQRKSLTRRELILAEKKEVAQP